MPTLVLLWVWICAYLNCAGWALSALHQLNAGGYTVAILLGGGALGFWLKQNPQPALGGFGFQKFRRRFCRPFPFAFLLLATMAFLGGVIYAPTNYDALAYRLPRIFHWLQADQWHWIHSFFDRVNNRACGIEWVSAPMLALLKTDRLLFLINTFSFLLLPGLVFSVFTRLGVRRRVAWHWMWLAPTGYCFVLQVGSIGNDLFGAVFALAAVDFALRAKNSGSSPDVFASVLAAALMTGVKLSSLPLLLPWAVAILPSVKIFFRRPIPALAVCVMALGASALPTIYLNAHFSDDWSGAGLKHGNVEHAALIKTGANFGLLAVQNLTPPVFPLTKAWERGVAHVIPASVTAKIGEVMVEPRAAEFAMDEMQMEENAGLGFGVTALVLLSALAAVFVRRKNSDANDSWWRLCVRWSPVISLLAVLAQSNLSGIGRILTPYYLLLLPVLLVAGGHEWLVRKNAWRLAALAIFPLAAALLVISPARPLFPAQTILGKIQRPDSRLLARMREVYSVYGGRNDGFAPARELLPSELKVLGVVTFDDPVACLWRMPRLRRIEYVCPEDTAGQLKSRQIEYVLLREQAVGQWFHCSLEDWLKRMNATIVGKAALNLRASSGPLDWYLVRLN